MPFQYPYPPQGGIVPPYQGPRSSSSSPVAYYYDELTSWPHQSIQSPLRPTNVVETKFIVKKNGPMGTSSQASAAASFFARAHQKLQLNNNGDLLRPPAAKNGHDSSEEGEQFPTNFR